MLVPCNFKPRNLYFGNRTKPGADFHICGTAILWLVPWLQKLETGPNFKRGIQLRGCKVIFFTKTAATFIKIAFGKFFSLVYFIFIFFLYFLPSLSFLLLKSFNISIFYVHVRRNRVRCYFFLINFHNLLCCGFIVKDFIFYRKVRTFNGALLSLDCSIFKTVKTPYRMMTS